MQCNRACPLYPNSDRECGHIQPGKTSRSNHQAMSALHLKADMCGAIPDVRYGPKADIDLMAGSQETWKFHLLRL